MAGNVFSNWWTLMKPYTKAYKELWFGVGVTGLLYYKISYGGKKAVKDKPAH